MPGCLNHCYYAGTVTALNSTAPLQGPDVCAFERLVDYAQVAEHA
jgi:hypothetical protein